MASRNYLFGLVTSLALGGSPIAQADDPQKAPVKNTAPAPSDAEAPLDEELLQSLGSIDTGTRTGWIIDRDRHRDGREADLRARRVRGEER